MVNEPDFEDDPGHGASPHDTEQRPSPPAPQIDEQEWRVRSGNQQIDRRVVEDFQDALESW